MAAYLKKTDTALENLLKLRTLIDQIIGSRPYSDDEKEYIMRIVFTSMNEQNVVHKLSKRIIADTIINFIDTFPPGQVIIPEDHKVATKPPRKGGRKCPDCGKTI